jgi:sugar/nucleoside kinase (ribokinase family)
MRYDVLSIGNAMVDLIAQVDDGFLDLHALEKGTMMLVDADESARRLAVSPVSRKVSGGSTGNTAACIASLGGRSGYIGKVGADALGDFYRDEMKDLGVVFIGEPHGDVATANCLAVVTPDGERTMSTYLGACTHLDTSDLAPELLSSADLLFIEGYLLDSPRSREAALAVMAAAEANGTPLALTLSDHNCVNRNIDTFKLIASSPACSVLIANERELAAFHGTSIGEAIELSADERYVTVATLGAEGSAVIADGTVDHIAAVPVERIVDLVGAGDSFAAGFLYGYVKGWTLRQAAELGGKCAARVISAAGARPSTPLAHLLVEPTASAVPA